MVWRAFTDRRAPAHPPAATMRLAGAVLLVVTLACASAGGIDSQSPPSSARDAVVTEGTFELHGETRSYRLYVPAAVQPAGAPLVVMLHGCTQSAADAAAGTRLDDAAGRHGFVVLYPEQAAGYHPQRCWRWYEPAHQQRDTGEPAAIAALTRRLVAELGVDVSRIYVVGISAGAMMAVTTALAFPELFAAVASHSGAAYGAAKDVSSALVQMREGSASRSTAHEALRLMADRRRLVPLLVIHGDTDLVVRPHNARDLVLQWQLLAAAAGVDLAPGDSLRFEANGRWATRQSFMRNGTPVLRLLLVEGLGHAWSGGSPDGTYADPQGPDATAEVVSFLLAHRRQ